MAILNEQHAEVEVIVDGQPAREYDNDDDTEVDTETTITKYVEVVSGKEFAFRILLKSSFVWNGADTVTARLQIDGKRLTGICLSRDDFRPVYGSKVVLDGEWSGTGDNAQLFKYVFTDITTCKRLLP